MEILTYLTDPRDVASLAKSCKKMLGLFQGPLRDEAWSHLKSLLKAIIDDDKKTVELILDKYPKLLLCNPSILTDAATRGEYIESQLTWQRLIPKHPLVMALERNQVTMVTVMKPYFEKLVSGTKEALRQWDIANQQRQAAKQRSENFDFESLIGVIAQENFPYGTAISTKGSDGTIRITKFSKKTEDALAAFRKTVLPDKTVPCDYYDINELLKVAFEAYNKRFDTFTSDNKLEQRTIFFVKVIGFIQSLLSREVAEAWCEGLWNVVRDNQGIGAKAKALKLYHGEDFYRSSCSSQVGLGFEYWAAGVGAARWLMASWDTRVPPAAVVWRERVEQERLNLEELNSDYRSSQNQLQPR